MKTIARVTGCLLLMLATISGPLPTTFAAERVLIVADEFPAMRLLATNLYRAEGISSDLVAQDQLPPDLTGFRAVVVYIHLRLTAPAEAALVRYALNGGRLVALHHSISSGKRTNEAWFAFLGVDLPPRPVDQDGYKWIEPATLELVNLAPRHFITTHQVPWPGMTDYTREGGTGPQRQPAFTLTNSEVYLNHCLLGPRTILLGFKYRDPATGRTWMQDRAGWFRPVGRGWLVYLQPGHSESDFAHPTFSRLVINSIISPLATE